MKTSSDKPLQVRARRSRLQRRYPNLRHMDIDNLIARIDQEDAQRIDLETRENPKIFQRRFGVSFWWSHDQRRALIEFARKYKLRDRQVQWLRYTGSLDLKSSPGHVKFAAQRWIAVMGWFEILVFAGIFAVSLTALVPQATQSIDLAARFTVCVAVVIAFCWLIHAAYVWPWKTQCRLQLNL